MNSNGRFGRITWIVLDSVGIGEMPDAAAYGDVGSDTLGNIKPLEQIEPANPPSASYGRCALASPGKDTTTGHWEMAGIHLDKLFPLYPHGFPREVMDEFERRTGRRAL